MTATINHPVRIVTDPYLPPVNPGRLHPAPGSGARLAKLLRESMPLVPTAAIAEALEARGVPSVVTKAYFEFHPADEAVPFFEQAVVSLDEADSGTSAGYVQFMKDCHANNLPALIAQSVEDLGEDETIKKVWEALRVSQSAATKFLQVVSAATPDDAPGTTNTRTHAEPLPGQAPHPVRGCGALSCLGAGLGKWPRRTARGRDDDPNAGAWRSGRLNDGGGVR